MYKIITKLAKYKLPQNFSLYYIAHHHLNLTPLYSCAVIQSLK